MDQPTVAVYESRAEAWRERRAARRAGGDGGDDSLLRSFRDALGPPAHGMVADLGCGPGWHSAALGDRVLALDAARAMLALVPTYAPAAARLQADLAHLPLRRHALRGAWASKSYVHVPRTDLPLALHELHRVVQVGGTAMLVLFAGDAEFAPVDDDDFPGRRFAGWPPDLLDTVVAGAGFTLLPFPGDDAAVDPKGGRLARLVRRERTLADVVGPEMRLLLCGLNPSIYAADAGIGFARPGNRFWPAALASGLVTQDRDPLDALRRHGIGMTDLVKRATARADELTAADYRAGLSRVAALVGWLQPRAVCFVGLTGWRAATDRRAVAGVQDQTLGGRPVYVMPNPSGLNAHSTVGDLAQHLTAAAALADAS